MLRIFRQIALWEAVSTICLFFIAMPMKYFFDTPEAVKIAGSIHGFFVVVFVIMLIMCTIEYKMELEASIGIFVCLAHSHCRILGGVRFEKSNQWSKEIENKKG